MTEVSKFTRLQFNLLFVVVKVLAAFDPARCKVLSYLNTGPSWLATIAIYNNSLPKPYRSKFHEIDVQSYNNMQRNDCVRIQPVEINF